jgi:phenylalanyl-tRNA synthetase beta chain
MTLQDCDKTLEEKDINEVVERVVDTLETELNASLRN